MKAISIIVLISILGVLVFSFIKGGNQAPSNAPQTTEVPAQNTEVTKQATTPNDQTMTSEEHAVMTNTQATGTDVGMEMPTTDPVPVKKTDGVKMDMGGMEMVTLSGKNFSFDKNEIHVKKGETVTIDFTSSNGFHDFVIDELKVKSERVNTGGTTRVTFVADKVGTYEYYCSVGQHRANGMFGKLIVE